MARDHQVPQFYLRNFQIPSQPGLIYSYKRKLKPLPLSVRKVAQEEDFYDLKDPSNPLPRDNVDAIFKMSEHEASRIIGKLLTASSFSLSKEDFGHLIWFVALQAFRTRFAREAVANHELALEDRRFQKLAQDKDAYTKRGQDEADEAELELRERSRQAFLSGDIYLTLVRGGNTEDHLMGIQLGLVKKLVPMLGRKHWRILETDDSRPFITSDHPVVTIPSPRHHPGMSVGYTTGWILLPLSPKRALLITNEWFPNEVMIITQEKMREYQWYIITRCYQSVFSHVLCEEYQKILDTTVEGEVIRVYLPEE